MPNFAWKIRLQSPSSKKSDATKMTSHKRKATKQKSKKNDILLLNNFLSQSLAGTFSDQMFLPCLSCSDVVADSSVCLGCSVIYGTFTVSETAHFSRVLPISCQNASILKQITFDRKSDDKKKRSND